MSGPLYHGTRAAFSGSGGYLFPISTHGGDPNHGASTMGDRAEFVYLTPDLDLAWAYAKVANGRGRPRVLEVMPLGPVEVDDSTVNGEEQVAYRCAWAKVLRVHMEEPKEAATTGGCRHHFEARRDADGPYKHCTRCGEDFDHTTFSLYHALREATSR